MTYDNLRLDMSICSLIPIIPVINRWNKVHKSLFSYTQSTAIVSYNEPWTIGSTLGLQKMTKYLRDITYIPSYHLGVIIGIILGDANITIQAKGKNARLSFKQSIINFPFFWSTFNILSHYVSSVPYKDSTVINGVRFFSTRFDTRAYFIFTLLHEIFIVKGKKTISHDLFHYITPVALAFWIMSDGSRKAKGLLLCTDSFTIQEVVILMNILMIRYGLSCGLHYNRGLPRIYIHTKSMVKLRKIVGPHMISFSNYKLSGASRLLV
uniref:Homing endonuclease LAGLIDADG domain-containing protein n=1 Tax=Cantharellus lutescens TaxID=104198 RepID=A0A2S0S4C4_9AGAM|nr:hypothetical protein [Cantharellus lutescens]AWA82191.1 hypothetical protein [Cantharellus lutescens]